MGLLLGLGCCGGVGVGNVVAQDLCDSAVY